VGEALGEELVGVYLSGSLALGDFDRASSDIDVLVATAGPLGEAALERLRRLHAELQAAGPWTAKLECVYLPLAALRRYDPADRRRYPIAPSDRGFRLGRQGPTWVLDRQVAREHGLVVLGPDPRSLIDPVAPDELRATARAHLQDFWAAQLPGDSRTAGPAWLRPRNYQAFAILSLCRALYTLQHGEVASKPAAAAWASRRLGPPWPSLVATALAWRSDERPDDAALAETMRLVADAVARVPAAG
jgi:Domain of unknown function (DUF4111)/Nucleotidyltransferase domain